MTSNVDDSGLRQSGASRGRNSCRSQDSRVAQEFRSSRIVSRILYRHLQQRCDLPEELRTGAKDYSQTATSADGSALHVRARARTTEGIQRGIQSLSTPRPARRRVDTTSLAIQSPVQALTA